MSTRRTAAVCALVFLALAGEASYAHAGPEAGAVAPAGAAPPVVSRDRDAAESASLLGEKTATWLRCAPTTIEVEDDDAKPFRLFGFHQVERAREGSPGLVWARAESRMALYLSARGSRTLRLTLRAAADGIVLRVLWNGHEIGAQPIDTDWNTVEYAVPADEARLGENTVDFRASQEVHVGRDPRKLAVCFDRVEILGGRDVCDLAGVYLPAPDEPPLVLAPGSIYESPVTLPRKARIRLEAKGGPGLTVEVVVAGSGGDAEPARPVVVPDGGIGTAVLDVAHCCDVATFTLVNTGRLPIEVTAVTLEEVPSGTSWRSACGQTLLWPLFAVLLVVLTVAAARLLAWLPVTRIPPVVDVVLIVLVALVARLVYLGYHPEIDYLRGGDGWEYLYRSKMLAHGQVSFLDDVRWHSWSTWIRPPGYYLFLALVQGPLGGGLTLIAQVQAVLGALTAGATWWLARELFGRGAALVAGLLFALYLETIVMPTWILSETLHMALLVPGLALVARATRRGGVPSALGAGLLLGLATLVRSAPLHYVPAAAVLLVAVRKTHATEPGRRLGRSLARALALVAGLAVVVVPWMMRNTRLYGMRTGIDNVGVANFIQASEGDEYVTRSDLDLTTKAGQTELFQRVKAANKGLRWSRESGFIGRALVRKAQHPVATTRTFLASLAKYYGPFERTYVPEYIGATFPCTVTFLTDLLNGSYLVIFSLGLAGIVLRAREPSGWPVLFWPVLITVALNLLFFWDMPGRFRLPVLPVFMAYGGAFVVWVVGRKRGVKPASS